MQTNQEPEATFTAILPNPVDLNSSNKFYKGNCKQHVWKPLSFHCSCGKLLCDLCLKYHKHFTTAIKITPIKNFYQENFGNLQFIYEVFEEYEPILRTEEIDSFANFNLAKEKLLQIIENKEMFFNKSLDELTNIKNKNLVKQTIDFLYRNLFDCVEKKQKKLDEILNKDVNDLTIF